MLGPRNYLARGYQAAPIGITVEGANILTRNLIIFGQGAIRCHPFVLKEMQAARNPDGERSVDDFDRALFGHIGFTISNAVRSLVMALTLRALRERARQGSHQALLPAHRALLGLVRLRHRRGDAVAGRLPEEEGEPLGAPGRRALLPLPGVDGAEAPPRHWLAAQEDQPVVEWACRDLLYRAQEQLHDFLRNFPNRLLAGLMRALIFPRGRTYFAPGDRLGAQLAELAMTPGATRERLCRHAFRSRSPATRCAELHEALQMSLTVEPIERRLRVEGVKTGRITALDVPGQIAAGPAAGHPVDQAEADLLLDYDRRIMHIINVDDFAPDELPAGTPTPTPYRSPDHASHDAPRWLPRRCCSPASRWPRRRPLRLLPTAAPAHCRARLRPLAPRSTSSARPDGATVKSPFKVVFGLTGMGVAPAGVPVRERRPPSPADRHRPAEGPGHAAACRREACALRQGPDRNHRDAARRASTRCSWCWVTTCTSRSIRPWCPQKITVTVAP